MDDIGIYTDIYESGKRDQYGHKLYYATCKVCGERIEKKLANIKRSNQVCRHKKMADSVDSINDMPKGWTNLSALNRKIYDTWKAMLRRTTQTCWDQHPTYKGTTVDESWKTLSVFVEDIKHLPGYEEWVNAPKKSMMLDKDTLVNGNQHYSKNTCCFISALESGRDVNKRHPNNTSSAVTAFVAKYSVPVKIVHNTTGEEKEFSSLSAACREMDWNQRNVYRVLSDKYPHNYSIKGWSIVKV